MTDNHKTEDFKCNVLIMGKTGTGKSTLLNYLCDTDLAKTGAGKPVTGEGIYEYDVTINGQGVRIFDSWGIEAGKVDRWKHLIDQSLQEHGVQKSMEDWFHSVIYCVQAGGGRVEDIDAEIIKRFLGEGYLLTVVLTKADQVDEDDEAKMKQVILDEIKGTIPSFSPKGSLNVIATCAEKKKTRSGETQPFGKEDVQLAILEGWKNTVLERMPKHVVSRMKGCVDDWEEDEKSKLRNTEVSGAYERNQSIYEEIKADAEVFRKEDIPEMCKVIMTDVVESCHKADTSLRKTFTIKLEGLKEKKENEEDLKWWGWLLTIPVIPVAWVNMKISEWFRSRSTEHIADERQRLEQLVETISDHLRVQCDRLEPKIAKELKRII